MDETDIWQSASAMINRYGEGAAIKAERRTDQLSQKDDLEGLQAWMRILAAIEELQKMDPEGRVH